MNRSSVLVVDDDELIRRQLEKFLTGRGFRVECADSGEPVMARLKAPDKPSLLILDLLMPRVGGLEILEEMCRRKDRVPTVVLSGVGQVSMVVKAVRLGASDYLVKPLDEGQLDRAVHNALEEHAHDEGPRADVVGADGEIISRSERMVRIRQIASHVADTDVPILILGESGVGKEVLARYIHSCSGRRVQPFVKVNCAALPADLLESELFGYERGAFTGAMRDRPGKFELAGKGTILLDEIGEMHPHLQAKLLHVLQDGEYTRLGGSRPSHADARVLAATNQRLEEAVAQGKFREDLYFRLNVVRLEIIPLRERPEDIPPLCGYFFEKYRIKYQRPARLLSTEAIAALQRYHWPGNVRELENVMKRFVILPDQDMAMEDLIETHAFDQPHNAMLPGHNQALHNNAIHNHGANNHAVNNYAVNNHAGHDDGIHGGAVHGGALHGDAIHGDLVHGDLVHNHADGNSLKKMSSAAAERVEKEMVLRTLREVNWNRKQAARELSISYKALLNKLRRWNVGGKSSITSA